MRFVEVDFSGTELLIHWRQAFIHYCGLHQVWRIAERQHLIWGVFHTPVGFGHAQWACHSPYKVLSFSYSFRRDEVCSSGWKLVFNESTVLFQRKSTSTITTTEWEIYISPWEDFTWCDRTWQQMERQCFWMILWCLW